MPSAGSDGTLRGTHFTKKNTFIFFIMHRTNEGDSFLTHKHTLYSPRSEKENTIQRKVDSFAVDLSHRQMCPYSL